MPTIDIPLDCGHTHTMEQWDRGDRNIHCEVCGRTWIMTAVRKNVNSYQTKTEIFVNGYEES